MGLTGGKQVHRGIKRTEHFQGLSAPTGVNTQLFILAAEPATVQAFKLFVGTAGLGNEMLVRNGVHYSVDLTTRAVTWLATAPYSLLTTNSVSAVYFTKE